MIFAAFHIVLKSLEILAELLCFFDFIHKLYIIFYPQLPPAPIFTSFHFAESSDFLISRLQALILNSFILKKSSLKLGSLEFLKKPKKVKDCLKFINIKKFRRL